MKPQPPYTADDVNVDTFGSGGANVVPGQGSLSMGDLFHDLFTRVGAIETEEGGVTEQSGTGTLVAGDSGVITATITANSRIFVTRKSVAGSTVLGELTANTRVIGAPGSFKVQSLTPASPATPLATDASTFDWLVRG